MPLPRALPLLSPSEAPPGFGICSQLGSLVAMQLAHAWKSES